MKTIAANFFLQSWLVCFCLALSVISAQSQSVGGIIANNLSFFGNNVTCDSFDSSNPAHSIWQTNLFFHGANYGTWSNTLSYSDSSLPSRTANVHVATTTNYISVGNAQIYGYIDATSSGVSNISANGSVGDLNWVHNGNFGIQPGHFNDDMNQTFTSLSLPSNFSNSVQTNNWLPVPTWVSTKINIIRIGGTWTNISGTWTNIGGTLYTNKYNGNPTKSSGWSLPGGDGNYYTYDYVITNRPEATNNIYYSAYSLGNIYVDAPYSVLYLTNGMSSPVITIGTNGDLFVYSRGDITFGTTINNTALTRALTICDVASHPINITVNGNASGISKFYVPGSSLTFNGGGSITYDVVTEIICASLNVAGRFNFHSDESLGITLFPSISSQPTNVIVPVGTNATFAVGAGGSSINYQWFFNQTNLLSGALDSSLTLTNVQIADAGNYSVVVTNSVGSVTSSPASLTVFTDATATVSSFSGSTGGQFQFSVNGVTGLSYAIQKSSNLVDWIPVVTNVSPFVFTDTNAVNFSQGFYRVIYPP